MGQSIGLDLVRVVRVWSRQVDLTSALRPDDTPNNVQEAAGGLNLAAVSGVQYGN